MIVDHVHVIDITRISNMQHTVCEHSSHKHNMNERTSPISIHAWIHGTLSRLGNCQNSESGSAIGSHSLFTGRPDHVELPLMPCSALRISVRKSNAPMSSAN